MGPLLASELRRFRRPALGAAAVHALLLAAVASTDGLRVTPVRLVGAALGYALAGYVLGVVQIASYRRGELWTFLLHRPLAPRRIFLALAGAASILLAIAVLAPLLLAALVSLGAGGEPRHLLLGPYAWGCALAFYLAGCFAALTPWRVGAALASALALVPLVLASLGGRVLVPLVVVLAWLGLLVAAAVRPDLTSPPRGRVVLVAAALPALHVLFLTLSLGALIGWSMGVAVAEEGWRGVPRFAWNDYFPAGSYPNSGYLAPDEALADGLRLGSPEGLRLGPPEARALAASIAVAPVLEIVPRWSRFPRRCQLPVLDRRALIEEPGALRRWTFRHDRMRLAGLDLRSGESLGDVGVAGRSFEAVPFLVGPHQVITPRRLYRFDGATRRVELRYTLPAGERFVAPVEPSSTFDLALGDRALHLFAPGTLLGDARLPGEEPPQPIAIVPLGGDAANLERAVVARLRDGYLVSFVFGIRSERELGEARQRVWIGGDGSRRLLVDAPLAAVVPAWVRHRGFVVSPALQALDDLVRSTLVCVGPRTGTLAELVAHPPPRSVLAAALVVALLSAAATWLLAGRRALRPGSRRAWTAAGLLLGLPVPFCVLMFTPSRH